MTGPQLSPPISRSNSSNSIGSLPTINEHAPSSDPGASVPASASSSLDAYEDWFSWLNADGAYAPPGALTLSPTAAPMPVVPPGLLAADDTQSDVRKRVHLRERDTLRRAPLHETAMGRAILGLTHYSWYRLANGLVAMQFAEGESSWRSNDCANNINWLHCGAYAHRCSTLNMLGVVRIEMLKPYFDAIGHVFFTITPAPAGWPVVLPIVKYPRPPRFLHANFQSPHDATPDERKNAGQAARRRP